MGMSKIRKYAKESFLNNKQIISETFEILYITEIAHFVSKNNKMNN